MLCNIKQWSLAYLRQIVFLKFLLWLEAIGKDFYEFLFIFCKDCRLTKVLVFKYVNFEIASLQFVEMNLCKIFNDIEYSCWILAVENLHEVREAFIDPVLVARKDTGLVFLIFV